MTDRGQWVIRRRSGGRLFRYVVYAPGGASEVTMTLWGARSYLRRWKKRVEVLDSPERGPVVYREGAP